MLIGCEDCKQCYNTCLNQFPNKYIDGGADKCSGFEQELDPDKIIENGEKKINSIRESYASRGIFV